MKSETNWKKKKKSKVIEQVKEKRINPTEWHFMRFIREKKEKKFKAKIIANFSSSRR